jgi:tRNA U38,U39,U40 pseudouridine synthase TruA
VETKAFSKTEKYLYIVGKFNHFFNTINHTITANCKDIFDIIEWSKKYNNSAPKDITMKDIEDCLESFHRLGGCSKSEYGYDMPCGYTIYR